MEDDMDENRFEGTANNIGGKVQKAAGDLTDDPKLKAEGMANQASGTAQKAYGQVKDAVREYGGDYGSQLIDQIEEAGDALAEQIDQRPITALLVAAGIGFLLALATKPAPRVEYRRR
jgi:uncharacterized protein YjbJ (UPF0337 family)